MSQETAISPVDQDIELLQQINPEEDFNPIPLKEAATWVTSFRGVERGMVGVGVIHTQEAMLRYLTQFYEPIKNKQPDKNKTGFGDYDWGVGHFFMRETSDDDHISFCVAPVLFKPDPLRPGHTDVLDPFDPNCPYKYTYSINNAGLASQDDDDVFDMGEMWP